MQRPSSDLTTIINTLGIRLGDIDDPDERFAEAREVAARARLIESIAGEATRSAVQTMRSNGASHAGVAARIGVTRARAQQLAGTPVLLADGPKDGETVAAAVQGSGRPNRQIVLSVGERGVLNYWRRLEPEPDGSWVADYLPGTRLPADFTHDLTIT